MLLYWNFSNCHIHIIISLSIVYVMFYVIILAFVITWEKLAFFLIMCLAKEVSTQQYCWVSTTLPWCGRHCNNNAQRCSDSLALTQAQPLHYSGADVSIFNVLLAPNIKTITNMHTDYWITTHVPLVSVSIEILNVLVLASVSSLRSVNTICFPLMIVAYCVVSSGQDGTYYQGNQPYHGVWGTQIYSN